MYNLLSVTWTQNCSLTKHNVVLTVTYVYTSLSYNLATCDYLSPALIISKAN